MKKNKSIKKKYKDLSEEQKQKEEIIKNNIPKI